MDLNLIRSLVTLALFALFVILILQVFSKKNKRHFDNAGKALFDDGDERSVEIKQVNTGVNNNE